MLMFEMNGEKIAELLSREEIRQMGRKQLADEIGIDRTTLYKIEKMGKQDQQRKPDVICKLASYFEVPHEELLKNPKDIALFYESFFHDMLQSRNASELGALMELFRPLTNVSGIKRWEKRAKGALNKKQIPLKLLTHLLMDGSEPSEPVSGRLRPEILQWIQMMDQRERKDVQLLFTESLRAVTCVCGSREIYEKKLGELEDLVKAELEGELPVLQLEYDRLGTGEYRIWLRNPDVPMDTEPRNLVCNLDALMKLYDSEEAGSEEWKGDIREELWAAAEAALEDFLFEGGVVNTKVQEPIIFSLEDQWIPEWVQEAIKGEAGYLEAEELVEELIEKAVEKPAGFDGYAKENLSWTAGILSCLRYDMETDGIGSEFQRLISEPWIINELCQRYGYQNPHL